MSVIFVRLINMCEPTMQKVALTLKDKLLPQYFKRRYVWNPPTRAQLTLPDKDEGDYQSSGNPLPFCRVGDAHSRFSQLPHKFDRVVFCPLTETQTAVYERLLQTPNVQNILRRREECDCGSKKPYVGFLIV